MILTPSLPLSLSLSLFPLSLSGETTGVACYLKAVNPAVIVDSAAAKPTKPAAVKAAVKGGPSSKGRPAPLSPSHIIMERSNDPPSLRPFTGMHGVRAQLCVPALYAHTLRRACSFRAWTS